MNGVARLLPGPGVVARSGDLLLICAEGGDGVDELLSVVAEVARSGGDGAVLVRRVAALLAADVQSRFPACALSGPAGDGRLAVLVHGNAVAEVVTPSGTVTLSGVEAITSVDQLVAGPVQRIQLKLPAAGVPDERARLDSGVVPGAGIRFIPENSTVDVSSVPAASWTRPTPPTGVAAPVFAAPVTAPPPPFPAASPLPERPMTMFPLPAQPFPPAPRTSPDDAMIDVSGSGSSDRSAHEGQPPAAWSAPVDGVSAEESRSADEPVPAEESVPSDEPASTEQSASAEDDVSRFVEAARPDGDASRLDDAAPPGGAPSTDAARPADEGLLVVADRSHVIGVVCPKGHFIDPRHPYCPVCGISMAQQTVVAREGVRPPLGILLVDDGKTVPLEIDYVIGRDPKTDPDAIAGLARPLKIVDAEGVVSRRHARIALVGWDVQLIDLGSSNGTYIQLPGAPERQQMTPNIPVVIRPGTVITLGRRWLRFEPPRVP